MHISPKDALRALRQLGWGARAKLAGYLALVSVVLYWQAPAFVWALAHGSQILLALLLALSLAGYRARRMLLKRRQLAEQILLTLHTVDAPMTEAALACSLGQDQLQMLHDVLGQLVLSRRVESLCLTQGLQPQMYYRIGARPGT